MCNVQKRQICEDGKQISGRLGLGVEGLEGTWRISAKRCPVFWWGGDDEHVHTLIMAILAHTINIPKPLNCTFSIGEL